MEAGRELESWEAESFPTLTALSTAMAGSRDGKATGKWLPFGQLVSNKKCGNLGGAGPSARIGTTNQAGALESSLVLLESWEGRSQACGQAEPGTGSVLVPIFILWYLQSTPPLPKIFISS